ncbi:MAG: hypothetical protein ACKPCM_19130, partial [Pseudanabaena sp.]
TRTLSFTGAGISKTSTVRVNACGFAKISNPSALTEGDITVNGSTFNVATTKATATITEPTCVDGVAANLPSTGFAFNVGKGAIVIRDLPTSRVLDATYTSTNPVIKKVSINACGFGVATNVSGSSSVSVDGGTPVNWDSQPYAGFSCSSGKLFASILSPNTTPQVAIPELAAVSRDANNNLIFNGAGSSIIPVSIAGANFTKSATSDRCSGLYLPAATTGIVKINGVSIDTDALPVRVGQETCRLVDGVYSNSQGYNNSRWSDGRVYIKNYSGLTLGDRSIVTVETIGNRNISVKTNSCGIGVLRSTTSSPLTITTAFTHNGTSATVGDLPLIEGLPSCSAKGLRVPVNY